MRHLFTHLNSLRVFGWLFLFGLIFHGSSCLGPLKIYFSSGISSASLPVVEFYGSSCCMLSCRRFGWRGIVESLRTRVELWNRSLRPFLGLFQNGRERD